MLFKAFICIVDNEVAEYPSNNNVNSNSKYLNKEILQFNLWITTNFELNSLRNSNYIYFELKYNWKVWIKWNIELTDFELTVQFNIVEIGKWQRFWQKFELSRHSN